MTDGAGTSQRIEYEAIGDTLEEALLKAHDEIRPREGFDFTTPRVIDWGLQKGGFTMTRKYYVRVVAEIADFKT
jgi:hypothetical protein